MQWELRVPLPEDMVVALRPNVVHVGDGWLVMPATSDRPEIASRVIDVGVGEMDGSVVLVGLSRERIDDAYSSSSSSCNSSNQGIAG